MNQSFTLQIRFTNQGSWVEGAESVDHIIVGITGPSNPPNQTVGANEQYVTFGPGMLPGTYTYNIQAYDASNNPLGTAATGTVNYQPSPLVTLAIPTKLVLQGSSGSGYFTMRALYQNLGGLAAGEAVGSIQATLSGPLAQVVTMSPGQTTVVFGPGAIFGQYSYSLQAYDLSSVAIGPPANGYFWYNPLANSPLLLQQSAAIKVTA